MFVTLLIVTFVIAALVSIIVVRIFDRPLRQILRRLIAEELSGAWHRYIVFAIYVVGISGGVRIWNLEQYILPRTNDQPPLVLDANRWTLEVYRTVIGTLQSVAWLLLVFFVFALLAYVIMRGMELRHAKTE
jgi:di/tricarboxylate transporter